MEKHGWSKYFNVDILDKEQELNVNKGMINMNDEEYLKQKQMKYEEETKQLEERTEEMKQNPMNEIKQIEEMSGLTVKELIFDSEICEFR